MKKYTNQLFLELLKVALLVIFHLLSANHNWAKANTNQHNTVINAETSVQNLPQPSQTVEGKKINPSTKGKNQENQETTDDDNNQHLPWTVPVAGFMIVAALYLGVLRFYPLLLLQLPAELKVPKTPITPAEFKLPITFVIWLKYPSIVLDAWVKKHIDTFEEKFFKNETVDERKDYVSISVQLNNQEIEELTVEDLRKTFKTENRVRLLICGEGGSGKTTIACQIAKWAMAKDKRKRLSEHLMLPVLIEQEFKLQSGEGIKPLMEEIVGQIQELSDGEQKIVDELLVEQLLRKRRILLIVDHFSEMSQQNREKINPEIQDFPANALVITSRIEEKIKGIDAKIKTLRFDSGKLAYFIEQYLKQCHQWDLFKDDQEEFLQKCAELSRIVSDRKTITVLLAKLYALQMINTKENSLFLLKRAPENIPELIIDHINKLNSEVERLTNEEYHTLEQDAKFIAWKCLEQNYKSTYVDRSSIITVLGEEKVNNLLEYFEKKLHLIKSGKTSTIRFVLDPLAEYLAGLYLVENYNETETSWNEFLHKANSNLYKGEEIKGFLSAVRECCIAKGVEANVPNFVLEELGQLVGIDPEAEKQEHQKRRIRRLVDELSVPEIDDRRRAAKELMKIGIAAKTAVPALLKALKDNDNQVRCSVTQALGNLGNTSEPVLQRLLLLLKDEASSVRSRAAEALGKLGNSSESILRELQILLEDEDSYVRLYAAEALGKLGYSTNLVLETLLELLEYEGDPEREYSDCEFFRLHTVEALVNLGDTSILVQQTLHGLLYYSPYAINLEVAKILIYLGDTSEQIVQGLLAVLEEEDPWVRLDAAKVLVDLGNLSNLVVQTLQALMDDEDSEVCEKAAKVLELQGLPFHS